MTLDDVKIGDAVAVFIRERWGRDRAYKANRLEIVTKATLKQIFTMKGYGYSRETGLGIRWQTKNYKISADPEVIAELRVKEAEREAASQERKRLEDERDTRRTYQLARRIRFVETEELETVGEELLQKVVDALESKGVFEAAA